jgi:hypothetical protein
MYMKEIKVPQEMNPFIRNQLLLVKWVVKVVIKNYSKKGGQGGHEVLSPIYSSVYIFPQP